jgi:integrase
MSNQPYAIERIEYNALAMPRQQAQTLPLGEYLLQALAAIGGSENTKRSYKRGWGDFLSFLSDWWNITPALAAETKEPRDDGKLMRTVWAYAGDTRIFAMIEPSLRDAFDQALQAAGLESNSRSQRINAVNALLSIAYRDGYITDDQARRLSVKAYKRRQKRDVKPVGRRLSREEVRALRATIDLTARNDYKKARDLAIIDLMLFAGLRREEVASLSGSSFYQDGGRWWVLINGKGDATRRVKVHDQLFRTLETWVQLAGLRLGNGNEPLFENVNRGGNPTGLRLNASVIGRLVLEYGDLAGLPGIAPHDLRRTCARNAYDNGATVYQVQTMLGHSSPETTIRYIGSLEDDTNTAVDRIKY